MQLLPQCHLVASGYLGFGLTSDWDSHAYLLRSGGDALLIDTGCGRATGAVVAEIDAALGEARLGGIAVTHGHVDHSGGAAALAEHYGVPVYAHSVTAGWLETANEDAIGLPAARAGGTYPPDQVLRGVRGVIPVEGTVIQVGDLRVRAIATPGHSADHVVYVCEFTTGLALFSGDLVFAQGRIALLDLNDVDPKLYEESIRAMNELRPEHFFPGHGAVAIHGGHAHLAAAVAAYDRGETPVGLVA